MRRGDRGPPSLAPVPQPDKRRPRRSTALHHCLQFHTKRVLCELCGLCARQFFGGMRCRPTFCTVYLAVGLAGHQCHTIAFAWRAIPLRLRLRRTGVPPWHKFRRGYATSPTCLSLCPLCLRGEFFAFDEPHSRVGGVSDTALRFHFHWWASHQCQTKRFLCALCAFA